MKKIILTAVVTTSVMFATNAQIVTIPDANFKAYLVGNAAINTNADTEIQESEAAAFTGGINCDNLAITDLTGIEAFTAVAFLNCADNQLTNLDLSANTALFSLDCSGNFLTNLDLNNNTALNSLYCFDNQLSLLDVTNNTALTQIYCQINQLNNFDVSATNALQILYCHTNQLLNLDVSANTALERLYCATNYLTTLNLSSNTVLERLSCGNNELTTLNVNNNNALNRLSCSNNLLSSLYVKNGNNTNFITFESENNPDLLCIEVDDPVYCADNWLFVDAASSFSEECNACIVNIPDANFKAYLVGNTAINTNGDTEIQCDEAQNYTGTINCSFLSISDLTGIEAFTSLYGLNCNDNLLTSIDLSSNSSLGILNCANNQLSTINLLPLSSLTTLNCSNNLLTTVNLVTNTSLTSLSCSSNQINQLSTSNQTSLGILECNDNLLTSLDISGNSAVSQLRCQDNLLTTLNAKNGNNSNFTAFNASGNANLICIEVDNEVYSTTNWTNIDPTSSFSEDCASLGIDEHANEIMNTYPNPAQISLNIEMKRAAQINIINILGEIVLKQSLQIGSNSINVSEFSSGVYLIQTENGTTFKFVKE